MELNEYIRHEVKVLRDLRLWKYLDDAEKSNLYDCKSEAEATRLVRTYRNKYYDIMCADYDEATKPKITTLKAEKVVTTERKVTIVGKDISIEDVVLSKRTFNALKRAHISTLKEFTEFVTKYGWSRIRTFGKGSAEEVFAILKDIDMNNMTNEQNEELLAIVEHFKDVRKRDKQYKM